MSYLECPKDMVYIPAGTFNMGSTNGESNEQPVSNINVSGFCMDKHEVTNAEYSEYWSANSQFELIVTLCKGDVKKVVARGDDPKALAKRGIIDGEKVCALEVKDVTPRAVDRSPSPRGFDGPDQPVVNVDWYEADAFCKAQGKSLPTEAEWEKAARGPRGYEYGTRSGRLNHDEAHYNEHSTADVCSYPENGYGLCDMVGNVWEWVSNWYGKDAYRSMKFSDPQGPSFGDYKVLRGGSWFTNWSDLRAAHRFSVYPGVADNNFGFRCVADPLDSEK